MASMYFSSTSSHWPIVPRSLLTTIRSSSVTFPSQQYAVKGLADEGRHVRASSSRTSLPGRRSLELERHDGGGRYYQFPGDLAPDLLQDAGDVPGLDAEEYDVSPAGGPDVVARYLSPQSPRGA